MRFPAGSETIESHSSTTWRVYLNVSCVSQESLCNLPNYTSFYKAVQILQINCISLSLLSLSFAHAIAHLHLVYTYAMITTEMSDGALVLKYSPLPDDYTHITSH